MTRLLLICFSFALGGAAWCATVSGAIEITQRAQSHESLSDIVVWLEAPGASSAAQPAHVQLLQKDKMFHPHVLAITVGSTVDFPNADPIFHNAFSNFEGQIFDIGLYPPGTSRSIHFRRRGIVRVFCNIHPSMSAVIVVLDTPYFTKADQDGHYQITGVPPGNYVLRVFDERATAEPDVDVTITVEQGQPSAFARPVRLSELGYVRQPHKNKYGVDYPAANSDSPIYSGPPQ